MLEPEIVQIIEEDSTIMSFHFGGTKAIYGLTKGLSEKFCDVAFSLEKLVRLTTTFRIGSKANLFLSA